MTKGKVRSRLRVVAAEKCFQEGKKLTFRDMAEGTGLPVSVITKYMTDQVARYDGETLAKLCDYFKCEVGDILVYVKDDAPTDNGS